VSSNNWRGIWPARSLDCAVFPLKTSGVRQFHEAYQGQVILSPLLRELPWTHDLIILSRSQRPEEREFYLKMAAQEKWSKRELERQFDTALFERIVLGPAKVSPLVAQIHPGAASVFKDSYLVEFLDLPAKHLESDLQRGLLAQLRQFLLELGRDFFFVGSEYASRIWCSEKTPLNTSCSPAKAWARPSQRTDKKSICRRSSTASMRCL
jgi:predicted nuclease of restriction endonuclease-like (RecB) superfamily